MPKPAVVLFLCRGSRGDVAPIVAVAERLLAAAAVACECVVATEAQHTAMVAERAERWVGAGVGGGPSRLRVHALPGRPTGQQRRRLGADDRADVQSEWLAAHALAVELAPSLVVFSLFAPEGYSIAERLQVPAVALSPFVLARAPPARFDGMLAEAHPELCRALQHGRPGQVSESEVQAWMWRLFLDDMGNFREAIGLPSCPLLAQDGAVVVPLPPPTPLLIGVSPAVVDPPGYWPSSVRIVGSCVATTAAGRDDDGPAPPAIRLLKDGRRPVCIGFGSMEHIVTVLAPGQLKQLVRALLLGLRAGVRGRRGAVVLAPAGSAMHAAWEAAIAEHGTADDEVELCTEAVPHDWLFPQCAAVIHHGGAGTVGAALRSGRPQVLVPFFFDQFWWAETLQHKGLCTTFPASGATPGRVRDAVAGAGGAPMQARAAAVAAAVAAEDGAGVASSRILEQLQRGSPAHPLETTAAGGSAA